MTDTVSTVWAINNSKADRKLRLVTLGAEGKILVACQGYDVSKLKEEAADFLQKMNTPVLDTVQEVPNLEAIDPNTTTEDSSVFIKLLKQVFHIDPDKKATVSDFMSKVPAPKVDAKHHNHGTEWYCHPTKKSIRVKPEDVEAKKAEGYSKGKKFGFQPKTAPGVDPWVIMHKVEGGTKQKEKIHKSEVPRFKADGWQEGRGKNKPRKAKEA